MGQERVCDSVIFDSMPYALHAFLFDAEGSCRLKRRDRKTRQQDKSVFRLQDSKS